MAGEFQEGGEMSVPSRDIVARAVLATLAFAVAALGLVLLAA